MPLFPHGSNVLVYHPHMLIDQTARTYRDLILRELYEQFNLNPLHNLTVVATGNDSTCTDVNVFFDQLEQYLVPALTNVVVITINDITCQDQMYKLFELMSDPDITLVMLLSQGRYNTTLVNMLKGTDNAHLLRINPAFRPSTIDRTLARYIPSYDSASFSSHHTIYHYDFDLDQASNYDSVNSVFQISSDSLPIV